MFGTPLLCSFTSVQNVCMFRGGGRVFQQCGLHETPSIVEPRRRTAKCDAMLPVRYVAHYDIRVLLPSDSPASSTKTSIDLSVTPCCALLRLAQGLAAAPRCTLPLRLACPPPFHVSSKDRPGGPRRCAAARCRCSCSAPPSILAVRIILWMGATVLRVSLWERRSTGGREDRRTGCMTVPGVQSCALAAKCRARKGPSSRGAVTKHNEFKARLVNMLADTHTRARAHNHACFAKCVVLSLSSEHFSPARLGRPGRTTWTGEFNYFGANRTGGTSC